MKGVVGAEVWVITSGMRCAQRAWDSDWELIMADQEVGDGGMAGRDKVRVDVGELAPGWC